MAALRKHVRAAKKGKKMRAGKQSRSFSKLDILMRDRGSMLLNGAGFTVYQQPLNECDRVLIGAAKGNKLYGIGWEPDTMNFAGYGFFTMCRGPKAEISFGMYAGLINPLRYKHKAPDVLVDRFFSDLDTLNAYMDEQGQDPNGDSVLTENELRLWLMLAHDAPHG